MTENNTASQDTSTDDASEYLEELASTADSMIGEYVFKDVEVPDPVAGRLKADPGIEIVDVEKGEFGLDAGTMILSFRIDGPMRPENTPSDPPAPLQDDGEGLVEALNSARAHPDLIEYVYICREEDVLTGMLSSMHTFHRAGEGNIHRFSELGNKKERILWNDGAEEALKRVGNWDITNKPILESIVAGDGYNE